MTIFNILILFVYYYNANLIIYFYICKSFDILLRTRKELVSVDLTSSKVLPELHLPLLIPKIYINCKCSTLFYS